MTGHEMRELLDARPELERFARELTGREVGALVMLRRAPHAIHARPELLADPVWRELEARGLVAFEGCGECGSGARYPWILSEGEAVEMLRRIRRAVGMRAEHVGMTREQRAQARDDRATQRKLAAFERRRGR